MKIMVQTRRLKMNRLEIERKIVQHIHQMHDQMLPEVLQYLERLNPPFSDSPPTRRFNTAQVPQVMILGRDELHER